MAAMASSLSLKPGIIGVRASMGRSGNSFCQNAKIFEDTPVGQACVRFVHGAVHVLDVEQHVIEIRRGLADGIRRNHTAGFNRGLDTPGARLAQQSHGKFTLQQGFAARKGQAAARTGIEGHILFNHLQHIVHCTLFAINQQTLSRAGRSAGQITRGATAAVYVQLVVITQGDGTVRTGHNAVPHLETPRQRPALNASSGSRFCDSGLLHQRQERAQPLRKTMVLMPGPS